jgi:ABC-type lipoprotein release transport system permease subunit
MRFVWFRWRAEARATWRSLLVMIAVVGVGGGATLTAFAGARRTNLAVPRFLAHSRPDDGGFFYGSLSSPPVGPGAAGSSLALPPAAQRVVDLPQVAAHYRAPYLFLTPDPNKRNSFGVLNTIAAADPDLFRRVDRPRVVAGRLPAVNRPFDVAINELAAARRHLHVGSRVRLYAYSLAQIKAGGLKGAGSVGQEAPLGPSLRVRVAAIVRFPQDVSAVIPLAAKLDVSYEGEQELYLTPAFLPRYAAALGVRVQSIPGINLVGVRLRNGPGDWKTFASRAKVVGRGQVTIGEEQNVFGMRTAAASAQRGIHLEVVALLVFGVLAGALTVLVVAQAIGRTAQLDRTEEAALRGLGATGAQLAGSVLVRATVVGVLGSLAAVVVAVLASPLMPLGLARQAELHPGVSVDLTVLVPGVLASAALIVVAAAGPAWRVWRASGRTASSGGDRPTTRISPTRLDRSLLRSSIAPTATIGARYALHRGRGDGAVPVVGATVSAIIGVSALIATLTFGASLEHLTSSPRQQGWNWDVLIGNPNEDADREAQVASMLSHDHDVDAYSAIAILAGAGQGNESIQGVALDTFLAIDPLKGSVYPPLLEGRPPRGPHEIVLGTDTLEKLHRHVGQAVQVATPAGRVDLQIVGRMIAPSIGDVLTNHLGDGGLVSAKLVRQVSGGAPQDENGLPPTVFDLFAVRYAPRVSHHAAFARLQRDFGPVVLRHLPSEDVVNLQSVEQLPFVLAGLVALLGTAILANTLITAVRRRRRDLAIMKTMGFTRRQIASVIAWQATTFCVIALAVGIPLGLAAGRWAWTLVASGIGSVSPSTVATVPLALTAVATLGIGNLIAALPARTAARVPPAVVFRTQ